MATLDTTRNYEDGEVLTKADLDAPLDDIEAFLNVTKLNDDNIQNSGITGSTKLLNQSVTESKIAAAAITTAKVADSNITTAKIADDAITLEKLANEVLAKLLPPGVIQAYVSKTPPTGWLYCDGSAVSRSTYSDLYAVIGTKFGYGDNSTTFNLPDFRGRFLRGYADGTTVDPDAADRTAMATGGNTGDAVGSVQGYATALPVNVSFTADSNGAHTHTHATTTQAGTSVSSAAGTIVWSGSATGTTSSNGAHTHTISGGDEETRPKNANVAYIIKI